jgi:hypothetical protein
MGEVLAESDPAMIRPALVTWMLAFVTAAETLAFAVGCSSSVVPPCYIEPYISPFLTTATFEFSCPSTDITSVLVSGACLPHYTFSNSNGASLQLTSGTPGACHLDLVFATGFTYSADVTFVSGTTVANGCSGPTTVAYVGPTQNQFTVGNPSSTCADAGTGGAGNSGTRSGSTADASSDAIAPVPCTPTVIDAGTASAGDAEVPLNHRATGACCPSQRGPGPPTQPYPTGVASPGPDSCSSDSQCTGAVNGRCFPFAGLVGNGGCSYDQCFTDSNCASGTPCICRSSSSDNSPNVCAPPGNCVVDSDCGPGGYCSPTEGCDYCAQGSENCASAPYYCHTASDTCINDTDCPSVDGGEFSITACAYNPPAQRWACKQLVCLPP